MIALLASIPVYVIVGIVAALAGLLGLFLHKRNKRHLKPIKKANKQVFTKLNRSNERRMQKRWRARKNSGGRVTTGKTAPKGKKTSSARPASKPQSSGTCGRATQSGKPCKNHNSPGKDHCFLHAGEKRIAPAARPKAAPKQRVPAQKSSLVHTDERVVKHSPVKRPPGFSDSDWNNATEAQRRYAVTGEGKEAAQRDTSNQAFNSFFKGMRS